MKLKAVTGVLYKGRYYPPGETLDVPDEVGTRLAKMWGVDLRKKEEEEAPAPVVQKKSGRRRRRASPEADDE